MAESGGADTRALLEDVQREVRQLRRDLYGNPNIKQKGVFDRLEDLEDRLNALRTTYERERLEVEKFRQMETELDELRLDYRIAIVYLRGIALAVATITTTLIGAAIAGILRFFSGAG